METYCGRPAVDALLFYYDNLAEIRHIDLSLQFQIPEPFSMTDVELCTLLGNLLENAVEACLRMPPEAPKRIRLKTACKPAFWYMVIEKSPTTVCLHQRNSRAFFTRKKQQRIPRHRAFFCHAPCGKCTRAHWTYSPVQNCFAGGNHDSYRKIKRQHRNDDCFVEKAVFCVVLP